jgi:hypothetical protein
MSSYHPIPYQEPGSKYFPQWQATRSGSVTHMSPFNCCNEQIQSIAVFTQVHHLSHVQQFLDACDADALIKIEEVKTTQGFAWVAPSLLSDVDRSFHFVCRLHVFCRLPPLFTSTRPPTTFPQLHSTQNIHTAQDFINGCHNGNALWVRGAQGHWCTQR